MAPRRRFQTVFLPHFVSQAISCSRLPRSGSLPGPPLISFPQWGHFILKNLTIGAQFCPAHARLLAGKLGWKQGDIRIDRELSESSLKLLSLSDFPLF